VSKESKDAQAPDLHKQQLDALELATNQQLEALAQQRTLALESAKYWDGLAKQAAAARPDAQAAQPVPAPVSPTVLTEAHFNYLESVLKAQRDFVKTLLTAGPR